MSDLAHFRKAFKALTGNDPFPWQEAIYERLIEGNVPASCDIPTGLGKTAVVAVWLIALANRAMLPRRLVYVVNRRTVVDQTTTEVERLRQNLKSAGLWDRLGKLCALPLQEDEPPLAISTLRGQYADNREWSADPARPAVIVGTVDMIGSRLLFSGYGVGFKAKPLHAGFLGQDVLLVHDEAHLEPAFQELLIAIQKEQERCSEFREFRVMALTATLREQAPANQDRRFALTDMEKNPPAAIPDPPKEPIHHLWRRVKACKAIHLVPVGDEKRELADEIVEEALKFKDSERPILVFARTVENVEKIADKLEKEGQGVQRLTGTLRGLERDGLPADPVFARFLPPANRPDGVELAEGTVYLVCTSAGEVGVNITADHLVCDLTTFESMAQRFGRVNRFGDRAETEIHVVHPTEFDEKDLYEQRRDKTLELLRELNGDGSPAALGKLDPAARAAAFSAEPTILSATDILFDCWALTTIREKLPGRPSVQPYLHGLEDEKKAETYVAWRQEVWELDPRGEAKSGPLFRGPEQQRAFGQYAADLLADYPLKPHELLRDSTYRKNTGVRDKLAKLAETKGNLPVWIQEPDASVVTATVSQVFDKEFPLAGRTVILPPEAGGLMISDGRSVGLFDGATEYQREFRELYDVADQCMDDEGRNRRVRVWENDPEFDRKTAGMRLIRCLDLPAAEEDEDAEGRSWHWYELPKAADSEGSRTAQTPVAWDDHASKVTDIAIRIGAALGLPQQVQEAVKLAASFHDLGKKREVWQRSIGNPNPTDWHAKSGRDPVSGKLWKPRDICPDYRHEFGSLLDVQKEPEFQELSHEMKDLVLHLIAAGHGRARPHFPTDEAFDPTPGRTQADADRLACKVPRRFARLQRRYGRWGLAYLESLLRAADWAASADPSEFVTETKEVSR